MTQLRFASFYNSLRKAVYYKLDFIGGYYFFSSGSNSVSVDLGFENIGIPLTTLCRECLTTPDPQFEVEWETLLL
jgi:hypothetical protein